MKCARVACKSHFSPEYRGHICCSQGCWMAILQSEIGVSAAGMRRFVMMGDRKKIQAVWRKYERLATGRKLMTRHPPTSFCNTEDQGK